MAFHLITILIPTALLICMENSFWDSDISRDGNFVKSFKKSFKLYVDSGMKKKVEADIDILGNGQGGSSDFKKMFYNFIIEHNLRKI